jgi:hypothetical protein
MYRLIYKSRSRLPIDWDFIHELIGSSGEKNEELGITGILLASKSHFLQVLEGHFDEVNRLFLRIARDERHEEVQLISFDCVESRLFGGWSMHAVGIFEFKEGLVSDLIERYGEEEGSVRFPVEDWKVLAMISDLRVG